MGIIVVRGIWNEWDLFRWLNWVFVVWICGLVIKLDSFSCSNGWGDLVIMKCVIEYLGFFFLLSFWYDVVEELSVFFVDFE